jgi:hypothetical protein
MLVCALAFSVVSAALAADPATKPIAAKTAAKAEPLKPKTELILDTPEKALKSYTTCWQNSDYAGIIACIKITDANKTKVVEGYISYMMWSDYLERTASKKWGDDDAMKILSHVRTIEKQYELDIKKRIINANVDYDQADRSKARVFLRIETGRPDNLATDKLFFRDDYYMLKDNGGWKVDFLRTHELDGNDKDQEINYYANNAFPALVRKMKELSAGIKDGKVASADEAREAMAAAWKTIPGAASTNIDDDPAATKPAE